MSTTQRSPVVASRVSPELRRGIEEAARRKGIPYSHWLRYTAARAVLAELEMETPEVKQTGDPSTLAN